MKTILLLISVTVALLILPPESISAESKVVSVATISDYPPYVFTLKESKPFPIYGELVETGKDSKHIQGYAWDVLRESFHTMGYDIKLFVLPWARGMMMIDQDSVDSIFPTTKTKQRLTKYTFSEPIYPPNKLTFYTIKDISKKWRGLSSIRNHTLCVVSTWSYGTKFDMYKGLKKVRMESVDDCIKWILLSSEDKLRAVPAYEKVFDKVLKKLPGYEVIHRTPHFDEVSEHLMTIPTKSHYNEIFNKGLKKFKKTKKFIKIQKKWGS